MGSECCGARKKLLEPICCRAPHAVRCHRCSDACRQRGGGGCALLLVPATSSRRVQSPAAAGTGTGVQGRRVLGFHLPCCLKCSEKNVSVLDAADGLAAKQRTDRRPLGKPLGNLLSCPRDRSASASVNFAFALLKAVRKVPSPAPRTCQEPAAERSQVRQPPEDVEVVAWTRPRSPPSRSAALSCCFRSECQPFAVQPKLFSSWGLAPPLTDAAHASPKRNQSAPGLSPPWES